MLGNAALPNVGRYLKLMIGVTYNQRRARDSNPQPVSRHLISSQAASHSLTLQEAPIKSEKTAADKANLRRAPTPAEIAKPVNATPFAAATPSRLPASAVPDRTLHLTGALRNAAR